MHKIILTGGIASGKSEAAKIFQALDVPFIDSDTIVHNLLQINTPVYFKIIEHFGKHFILPNHEIDRKKLGSFIFTNPVEKKWLEYLLHPLVLSKIKEKISIFEKITPKPSYCIIDVPLYAEIVLSTNHPLREDFRKLADRVLVVDTDETTQKNRLQKRYQEKNLAITESEIKAILSAQVSREKRKTVADDLILNNQDLSYLKESILKLHSNYNI